MSHENLVVVRGVIAAVNRGDVEAACLVTADDAVFIPLRAGTEGAYSGHEGLRTFFADNAETFEIFRADYPDMRDLGDRVLVIGTVHIRGRGSGVETDIPSAGVFSFREGKITKWEDFGDRKAALQAAGLSDE